MNCSSQVAQVTEPGRLVSMIGHLSDHEVDFLLKGAPYASGSLPPAEGWVRLLSDADLREAYLGTDGEPENEVANLLAGECERRGIHL
jgi:hypothetical protein